jgi:hypothetical protein
MRAVASFLLLAAIARAAPDNLPSDCWFVTHFDVAALRKTATYAKLAPLVASAFEAIGLDEVGLKPEDIDSLTMGWTGAELDMDEPYVVLRGKIVAAKFEEFLATDGEYTATKRDGMTVFTPIKDNPESPRPHAAVFPGGPLLVAPSGGLEKLLATIKPDAPRSPVTELLATARPAQVVGGGVLTPKIRELLRENEEDAGLVELKSVVVSWALGEKIEIELRGTAEGEEAAKRAQAAIHAELARELPSLKDRVQWKREGAIVTGTLTLTLDEMTALVQGGMEVEGDGEAEDEAPPPER